MPSVKSKIVLHTFRNAEKNNQLCGVVKISPKAEQKLLELASETGLSIRAIASELILQAAEIVDIVEVQE